MKQLFSQKKKLFQIVLGALSLLTLVLVLQGSEKDSRYYQEVRESRMGAIEKVKRGKGKVKQAEITQHREGVNRTVLRGIGQKQLFSVAAHSANVRMKLEKES